MIGLPDASFQMIGFRVVALVLLATLHGFLIAGTALALGDMGPKHDGRLNLAPTRHIDIAGAFAMIVFGMGWSKEVAVDPRALRTGPVGVLVILLTGFAGLLAAAVLLDALTRPALTFLPLTAGLTTAAFLDAASGLAIWFALLSLLPVPPLAGGLIPEALGLSIPQRARWIPAAALVAAIALGLAHWLLGPAQAALADLLL